MRLAYAPYMLKFRQPSGTSRGILTEKPTYILKLWDEADPTCFGLGEASVFPGLSPEADGKYEYKIVELLANVALGKPTDLRRYPSLQLGLEEAIRDFSSGGKGIYFDTPFTKGQTSIQINGLIWMGNFDEMLERVNKKIEDGYKCIKIKIGALDWEKELSLLQIIRSNFSENELTLRVDANGGFNRQNVINRLDSLARLDIHSIEQPLPVADIEATKTLCRISPVPIALDEQLIGIYHTEAKAKLLAEVRPQYIILKPSLCGAFSGTLEWIKLAESECIGYWITSALESNVGLNAIAQFTSTLSPDKPQGLGTGALFTNNFETPLTLTGENLSFKPSVQFDHAQFENLDWRE